MTNLKKELIKYFKSLGIEVYTSTKARGHQGLFLKNRIDISKNTREERIIPTLLHEFTHYIHDKLEPNMAKTGGSLEVLFDIDSSLRGAEQRSNPKNETSWIATFTSFTRNDENNSNIQPFDLSIIQKELLLITHFVDENSLCHKLHNHKEQIKKRIKYFESEIKKDYPNFMRSKKFKEFDKYIKKSKAKYLLKYDRVKFISPFLRREEFFSIDNMEKDFPEMPAAFCAYIKLKSNTRKQARISARINRLEKYYNKPTELFSRLVEGIYIDKARAQALAPQTTKRFFELLENGYYFELKHVFKMLQEQDLIATF